jgi:hypothetical protein
VFAGALLALPASETGKAADARATASCSAGLRYAGTATSKPYSGIRAYINSTTKAKVSNGHVVGWLGWGAEGEGPNGADEWLQAGYVSFENGLEADNTTPEEIYYEVTIPGKLPAYHTVKANLKQGEKHQLSVLEVQNKANNWRVWLDGKAVSPVMKLASSHNKFEPSVTSEDWTASKGCNHYGYSFQKVGVAKAPGGSWVQAKAGYKWKDKGTELTKKGGGAFTARSTAAYHATAPSGQPPLLAGLASRLGAKNLSAECVDQQVPVRVQPAGHLLLSNTLCQRIVGFAVAQPYTPTFASLRFAFAALALDFLRGVANAAQVQPDQVDCRALVWFKRGLETLGVTQVQASKLRTTLLANRSQLQTKLSLRPSCPIH